MSDLLNILAPDALDVLEAAYQWTRDECNVRGRSYSVPEMDCVNLLMGFIRAKHTFISAILTDLGVESSALSKEAHEAFEHFSYNHHYGSPATFKEFYEAYQHYPLSVSFIHVLRLAREKALAGNRQATSLDLFEGFISTNHWGNRLEGVLYRAGYWVGFLGANQNKMHSALQAYRTQSAQDILLCVTVNDLQVQIYPYSPLVGAQISNSRLPGTNQFTAGAVFLNRAQLILKEEIRSFQELISAVERNEARELDIQSFLQNHPGFLPIEGIVEVLPQVELHVEEGSALIPDFLLLDYKGQANIVELKKPNEKLLVGNYPRQKFSNAVMKGLAQLREYRNYFLNPNNVVRFHSDSGHRIIRPSLTLVIGRRIGATLEDAFQRVADDDLAKRRSVITYDDLIDYAKAKELFVEKVQG